MHSKVRVSKELVQRAEIYQNPTHITDITLLVVGDSTAVGVGATEPTDTVAGLLAKDVHATHVENYAVSGAVIGDLNEQIAKATLPSYDYILIQVGGNDIIRWNDVSKAQAELETVLDSLPETNALYVMSAGNVGGTTFFPWFMNSSYTKSTLAYHTMFESTVPKYSGQYINLYEPPESDPFMKEPQTYLAEDGLHPSSAGYRLWYDRLQARMRVTQ